MASVNKVILIGTLGRDPEMRFTQGGTAVCTLNLATNRKYKNKSEDLVEETEWHKVTVWGKSAEHCNQFLAKGKQAYVEGRLHTSSYEDKEGVKKYSTEVIADQVLFMSPKGDGGSRATGSDSPSKHYEEPAEDDDVVPF
jgi:single-strand DNA-binding protein